MKFNEFSNPLENGCDIDSCIHSIPADEKKYLYSNDDPVIDLIDLIGFPEDFTDEELNETYGITMQEFLHPTAQTVEKVKIKLEEQQHYKNHR